MAYNASVVSFLARNDGKIYTMPLFHALIQTTHTSEVDISCCQNNRHILYQRKKHFSLLWWAKSLCCLGIWVLMALVNLSEI